MPLLTPLNFRSAAFSALPDMVHQRAPALTVIKDRLARAFVIASPWAPGFCCIGAELALDGAAAEAYGAPRLSLAGNGESLEVALIACLGEAAERLAVVERAGDVPALAQARAIFTDATWIAQAVASAQSRLDWVVARDAITSDTVALPADLCLRRAPERRRIEPAGALSAGVAAGPDLASAVVRATLELCERDAAALWWLGGRRPKAFPLEHPASTAGAQLIASLRRGCADRRTLLLDITTDLGIPAAAAVSLDSDGRGLACGTAARLDWGETARAALLEMCQMELAAPLAVAKRAERGDTALNDADRRHLERAAFTASACAQLDPDGVSTLEATALAASSPFEDLVARLGRHGVRLFTLDLTRPDIGVAAARAVSPELQPFTPDVVTDRLRRCRAGGIPPAPVPLM